MKEKIKRLGAAVKALKEAEDILYVSGLDGSDYFHKPCEFVYGYLNDSYFSVDFTADQINETVKIEIIGSTACPDQIKEILKPWEDLIV